MSFLEEDINIKIVEKERKRFRAVEMRTKYAMPHEQIARTLGVSLSSVVKWLYKYRVGGLESLKEKSHNTWPQRKAKI